MPRCLPPSTAVVHHHARAHTRAYTTCNVPDAGLPSLAVTPACQHRCYSHSAVTLLLLQSTTTCNRAADTDTATDRNRVARALRYGSMCGLRRAASTAAARAPDTRVGVARRGG